MRTASFVHATLIVLFVLAAAGCNRPAGQAETATPDITQAYHTVEARLTQNATLMVIATATSLPTAAALLSPSPTAGTPRPTPTLRPAAQPTQAAQVCDQATYGNPLDVTIPDGTRMTPGFTFTKTWRLVNNGTCTWSTEYTLAFFSGESMGAPATVQLPASVAPGGSVDLSVDLVAPQSGGTYRGNWKLRNAAGVEFGIGPGGGSPFWVEIVVGGTAVASVTATATATVSPSYPGGNPNPGIAATGRTTMLPGDRINLDTNRINPGAGEDLAYLIRDNGNLVLTPLGNGLFGAAGRATPTLDSCSSAALGAAVLRLQSMTKGDYICYRTDQGLFGYMRLIELDESNGSLSFDMLTWAQP